MLIFVAAPSDAEFAAIPYHDLLNSDVVVVATLEDHRQSIDGDVEHNVGRLRVSEVFAGGASRGAVLEIYWRNSVRYACRTSHERLLGKEAIWFLRNRDETRLDADHIQRAMSMSRDVLENFVEYFPKLHGPPDTTVESALEEYVRRRLRNSHGQ
jgi:hypothetical protein